MEKEILKALITFGIIIFAATVSATENTHEVQQIGGVNIPDAFSNALRDSMSVPLFLHLDGTADTQEDQRIGSASIMLDDNVLKVRNVQLEENENNATLNEQTRQELTALANKAFDKDFAIQLGHDAHLSLNLRQLTLQLVVNREALGTLLLPREQDIGKSSSEGLSNTLTYNFGAYSNQMRTGANNTSSYVVLNNVTALREHHIMLDSTLYNIGTNNQQAEIYKVMYEHDFAGYRIAGGMLDAWILQSLGPITAITAGKVYGMAWGNQANSTVFNTAYSVTPIIVFLPSAGDVHILRDGKLLSVQNFTMGNHEVDTRELPYGIYDVTVEVYSNNRVVSKSIHRVNKLYSHLAGVGVGLPLGWQVWGGTVHMDAWTPENGETQSAKTTSLIGLSGASGFETFSWAASAYNYNAISVGETHFTWPVNSSLNLNMQNMVASDSSWSNISSLSTSLPGGFSTVWLSQEKTEIGHKLRRSNASNRSIGASLNLNALWSKLGTITASYNVDLRQNSRYYTADYAQTLLSGKYGLLGLRIGVQRYNANYDDNTKTTNTQKYIALDFSLPLGSWLRAGITHQNGYSLANLSAERQFSDGVIRTIGADISHPISDDTGSQRALSGGVWSRYDTRYSAGAVNINTSGDGYFNANMTATGSVGWQGKNIAASSSSTGNAGIIFRTGLADDSKLTARINGRPYQIIGARNYLPLPSFNRYDIEIQNSKDSVDSYDIARGRKSHLTLYPGNVVSISPEVKQMVTVSGRIRAEDGTLLANARLTNHIGRTRTDEFGEFVMDIDKKFPTIDFEDSKSNKCAIDLDVSQARGAVWVGDIVCEGLKTYASTMPDGVNHEG